MDTPKAQAAQDVLPFVSQPEHALALLGLLAQAQLPIEDLLGQISKGFIEQLLVLSDMALRWTVMGFLESERGMRRIKGFAQLPELVRALRPQPDQRLAA